MPENWLKVEEAAKLWRVCPQTIRRWGQSGLIEVVKFTDRTHRVLVITGEDEHGVQGQAEEVEAKR